MIIRAHVTYTRELLLKWAKFHQVRRINQIITYIFAEAMMLVIVGSVIFLAVISASSWLFWWRLGLP